MNNIGVPEILLILIVVLVIGLGCNDQGRIEEARNWARVGDLAKAESKYRDYLVDRPTDFDVRLEFADLLCRQDDWKKTFLVLSSLGDDSAASQMAPEKKSTLLLSVARKCDSLAQPLAKNGQWNDAYKIGQVACKALKNCETGAIFGNVRDDFRLQIRVASEQIRSNSAFAGWMSGEHFAYIIERGNDYWVVDRFSELLSDEAIKHFNQQEYRQAEELLAGC